jgi:hypothetical protein
MARTKSKADQERSRIGALLRRPLLDGVDNTRPVFAETLNDPANVSLLVDHVIRTFRLDSGPPPAGFLDAINARRRAITTLREMDMRRAELRRLQLNAYDNVNNNGDDSEHDTDYQREFILETLALAFGLGYTRQTALVMGLHPRLGAGSALQSLSRFPELLEIIASMAMEISPAATRLFKSPDQE